MNVPHPPTPTAVCAHPRCCTQVLTQLKVAPYDEVSRAVHASVWSRLLLSGAFNIVSVPDTLVRNMGPCKPLQAIHPWAVHA